VIVWQDNPEKPGTNIAIGALWPAAVFLAGFEVQANLGYGIPKPLGPASRACVVSMICGDHGLGSHFASRSSSGNSIEECFARGGIGERARSIR
jgi:hypothetical protein